MPEQLKPCPEEAKVELPDEFIVAGSGHLAKKVDVEARIKENKLKPCPFCDGEAKRNGPEGVLEFWIGCKSCHATTRLADTKIAVTKAWNKRTK